MRASMVTLGRISSRWPESCSFSGQLISQAVQKQAYSAMSAPPLVEMGTADLWKAMDRPACITGALQTAQNQHQATFMHRCSIPISHSTAPDIIVSRKTTAHACLLLCPIVQDGHDRHIYIL